jgi:peptidoglycan hydrolase-like protein with peptidoglycan-binding domain
VTDIVVSLATPPTSPTNPSSLYTGTGNGTFTMTWTAPATDGGSPITGYIVEYQATPTSPWATIATSTATQTVISGLVGGQYYDFRVSAVNAVGTSLPSTILNTAPASVSSGGGSYSYTAPTTTTNTSVVTPVVTVTHKPLLGGGEPNVPTEFQGQVCKRYMREYILPGANNNPEEVKKLQTFLNEYGESLPVDGTYDLQDIEAVKRFQTKYKNQILSPWGLDSATGRVYRTTTAKINLMMCGNTTSQYFTEYLKVGDVSLESVKVQDFLNIIFSPTSGYPNTGLPLTKTFTKETAAKLKEFQSVYKTTVLIPWNLTKPTGWFYQTTRSSANALIGYSEGEIKLDNGTKIFVPTQ